MDFSASPKISRILVDCLFKVISGLFVVTLQEIEGTKDEENICVLRLELVGLLEGVVYGVEVSDVGLSHLW